MNLLTVTVLTLALCLLPGVLSAQCANNANIYSFVYNNKTYEVVKENLNWSDAAACAVQRGGKLAEIDSQAEQTAIYGHLSTYANISVTSTRPYDGGGAGYVWIGGTDRVMEGTWIWDGENSGTGSQFWQGLSTANGGSNVGGLYTNWGNEPDNYGGTPGQDALAIALSNWPFGVAGQWNDLNETNQLYYLIEYPDIVPVELTTFSADRVSGGVRLQWHTATERNNLGWTVERREGAENWVYLAFITGMGTTNSPQVYTHLDRESPRTTLEYRLRQFDTDGRTENSHPVQVQAEGIPSSLYLYQNHPNPFRERTTITYTVDGVHPAALTITDVAGREVLRFVDQADGVAGLRTTTFDGTGLLPGIYFYRLETGRFIHTRAMLLVK